MAKPVAHLHIGGMIAGGFSASGHYFLAVSHDGRGVFDCATWNKVARDDVPHYPDNGIAFGIGPIEGERIAVAERGNRKPRLICGSADGAWRVVYEGGIAVVTRT